MKDVIKIPKGFKIGHSDNGFSGVTVFLSEKGAVAGCSVRGGAPGTRETDLLRSEKAVQAVNAVVLCGGSAYGLNACGGVMEYFKDIGKGYKMGSKVVPIVCGAVIYDLNQKGYHYPDAEMGKKACENASDKNVEFGQVGVGKGATVGKIRGMKYAEKSGIGAFTVKTMGITMTAIAVVNALGDVYDIETGEIVAGAKDGKGGYINTERTILTADIKKILLGNTTLVVLLTNAKIDKLQANKLADIAQDGFARAIKPVHTDYDGDSSFVMSTAKIPVVNFAVLQSAAVVAVERAIVNAAKSGVEYEIEYDEEEK